MSEVAAVNEVLVLSDIAPGTIAGEFALIWGFLSKSSIPNSWAEVIVRSSSERTACFTGYSALQPSSGMLFPLSLFTWQSNNCTWHRGRQKSPLQWAKELPVPFLLQQLGNCISAAAEKNNNNKKILMYAFPFGKRLLLIFFFFSLRLWICLPSECDSARSFGQTDVGCCQAADKHVPCRPNSALL